jgi:2-amino-4-hydroxy-6-hydroxymethyldihydropteridine diphosphokinase
MSKAAIGLGSNLGDRLATMRAAVAEIEKIARVVARSRVYETEPVGPPQPRYLNAVVVVEYMLYHLELFDALLRIEVQLGRVRRERWGPRVVDLDVLLIEGEAIEHPRLLVPHPHLEERAFALVPLLDVWPDAKHPTTGRPYAEIATNDKSVRRTELSLL